MRNNKMRLCMIALFTMAICLLPASAVKAETALAISFGTINYEELTMKVYNNNNTIVYYSTDNETWTEVEGTYDSTNKYYEMDISWVSSTADITLYFKGDTVKTIKSITLPAQNTSISIDYDKVDGSFTFSDAEEANSFEWRKSTDYNWNSVDVEETSTSYKSFLKTIENFKLAGASIIIRIPQVIGTGIDDVGMRSSKEVTVSIAARAAAPIVKVNSTKLTLNTTTAMEYYDSASDLWIECSAAISLEEVAPKVLYTNGAKAATVLIRKAATTATTYSKTATIIIPGQAAAPSIGDSSADVTYYSMNSKLMLQFNKATATNMYEYAIVKADDDFDVTKASWKTVKASTVLTISSTTAPEGCTVYVRKKGTDATTTVDLVLSSAINNFIVKY